MVFVLLLIHQKYFVLLQGFQVSINAVEAHPLLQWLAISSADLFILLQGFLVIVNPVETYILLQHFCVTVYPTGSFYLGFSVTINTCLIGRLSSRNQPCRFI